MVFQSPNPFPKSIHENVSYGPRKHGDIQTGLLARLTGRAEPDREEALVERSLERAALWGGEQPAGRQRARTVRRSTTATLYRSLFGRRPGGHPHGRAGLGARSDRHLEDRGSIEDLAQDYTVVVVTHSMQQAARVSDQTAVFLTGGEFRRVRRHGEDIREPRKPARGGLHQREVRVITVPREDYRESLDACGATSSRCRRTSWISSCARFDALERDDHELAWGGDRRRRPHQSAVPQS